MAEVLIDIKVMDLFTPRDYQTLESKVKRHGAHQLYFQGEGIRIVRDTPESSHIKELHIKRVTSKTLPPYLLLLKDIEYAIENYKSDLRANIYGGIRQSARRMG